jgi:hypothetical protein
VTQGDLVSSDGEGMAGIVRHSQTKGRATGDAKPGLKPAVWQSQATKNGRVHDGSADKLA